MGDPGGDVMRRDPEDGAVPASTGASAAGLIAIYHEHRGALLRFLTARCGDADLAQDLMQDLWLKLNSRPTGPVGQGRAYLFRTANNMVLDHARSRHRSMARDRGWIEIEGPAATLPEDRPDPSPDAEEQLAHAQEAVMLNDAIAALPPGARQALLLYRLEERSQADIAGIMGISRSGVEKHLALAMKHLRKRLVDCGLIRPAASDKAGTPHGGKAHGERSS